MFRKEWIRPIKWVKPRRSWTLEDEAFGNNSGHVKFELTAKIDADGSVHMTSKNKLKLSLKKPKCMAGKKDCSLYQTLTQRRRARWQKTKLFRGTQ